MDDTDPAGESMENVESIIHDIHWLGFDWEDRLFYASDYFEKIYQFAVELIKSGDAYVCSLNPDEIREFRGTFTEPGKESPYRNRSIEENLDLFPRLTWPLRTLSCAIPLSTASNGNLITGQIQNGSFIPCMTLPIVSPTRWKE
jgi:glutamyl/glutaminyl-tRNA synthetase